MTHLTLVQLNDLHGYLDLHPEFFWAGGPPAHGVYRPAGGAARIAALIGQARAANPGGVLAFDCGDTFHGTYPAVQSKGAALLPVHNALGFAAMTAHWDFAYGPARLRALGAQMHAPILAANCYDKESGARAFPATSVAEAAGLRVGVVGLAATIVDKTMPPHFSEGLRFSLGNAELPLLIDELRREQEVDLVVVISHLGFPQDAQLAAEVGGIDVLLSAHTHHRLARPALINGAIVIQSGAHGSFLGLLDLEVKGKRVVDYRHRLEVVEAAVEPDAEVQALVDEALAPHRAMLAEVVGQTAIALHRNTMLECPMDSLLLESMAELTGAQLAFSNGWRYGAPVPPGPVTLNDLWNIIPVNPPVMTCTLTGAELRAMLEENLQHTFARDPYDQMGGYLKRTLGLSLVFKVENPPGQRVVELFVGDAPVEDGRDYTACFVTEQGVPARYGRARASTGVQAIDALRRHLARHSPVNPAARHTMIPA